MIYYLLILIIIISILFWIFKDKTDVFKEEIKHKNSPPIGKNWTEDIAYKVMIEKYPLYKWEQSIRDIPYLINPYTKKRLEIDICCKEKKIAIEVQGEQHYHYVEYFDIYKEGISFFYKSYMRDCIKRKILSDNGWKLIEIHYTCRVPYDEEKTYQNIYNYISLNLNKDINTSA